VENARRPHPPGIRRRLAWDASLYLTIERSSRASAGRAPPSLRLHPIFLAQFLEDLLQRRVNRGELHLGVGDVLQRRGDREQLHLSKQHDDADYGPNAENEHLSICRVHWYPSMIGCLSPRTPTDDGSVQPASSLSSSVISAAPSSHPRASARASSCPRRERRSCCHEP